MAEVVLGACLPGFQEVAYPSLEEDVGPDEKKALRVRMSLEKTDDTMGFMHGVLVESLQGNYILSGGSGSGKSTYAEALCEHGKNGSIQASDWVAVENKNGALYASDLN